jgi:hypothetical protein
MEVEGWDDIAKMSAIIKKAGPHANRNARGVLMA